MNGSGQYYTAGWKRFELNRRKMLANYDLAKFENKDRPLQTEHGLIAEANLRKWLGNFLPDRYGVTSGYIIPPTIEPKGYKQYHYDIIIYDKLDSPVIWNGENPDFSSLGQTKAILANRVKAIFEVKSSLAKYSVDSVKEKIKEVCEFSSFLPRGCITGAIFMELKSGTESQVSLLKDLIPEGGSRFNLGCVLRLNDNPDLSAVISSFSSRAVDSANDTILYRDIENYDIERDGNGKIIVNSDFPSLGIFDYKDNIGGNKQHFYKRFICNVGKETIGNCLGLNIEWSKNGFAFFALNILSYLAHKRFYIAESSGGYPFGLVFDEIFNKENGK